MHPQWRCLGSRIEYRIARPRVDFGRAGLGCVVHGGTHQSLGKHCGSLPAEVRVRPDAGSPVRSLGADIFSVLRGPGPIRLTLRQGRLLPRACRQCGAAPTAAPMHLGRVFFPICRHLIGETCSGSCSRETSCMICTSKRCNQRQTSRREDQRLPQVYDLLPRANSWGIVRRLVVERQVVHARVPVTRKFIDLKDRHLAFWRSAAPVLRPRHRRAWPPPRGHQPPRFAE